MNKKFLSVLWIVLVVSMFSIGSATLSGCGLICDVDKYKETVNPYLDEWDDAFQLANTTPRMSLPTQIENLQQILREVSRLEIQECLVEDHNLLLEAMDLQIAGFLTFLGEGSDTEVQVLFDKAEYSLDEWGKAINSK